MTDNVTLLPPRRRPGLKRVDQPDMRAHRAWWEENRDRLDWQPIATYVKVIGDLAYASPFVLRAGDVWTYGSWAGGGWVRFTEGATWPLPGFEPTHWADVDLDDAIMLGQE